MGTANADKRGLTYAESGVDIDAGDRMVDLIQHMMRRTHGPRVMGEHGAFAGMFRLDYNEKLFRKNYRDPVLVACTDGVGTKVKLAARLGVLDTIGVDCVAMNVNDLIVQGAEPLLFLDYIGVHKIVPEDAAAIVAGVSRGCEIAGCALLGGETAEMPDVYAQGDFDLAGFCVGVVELSRAIDPTRVEAGDVIIGLESDGLHSNGFSLVRRVLEETGADLDSPVESVDPEATLGEVVLTPTRIYAQPIVKLLSNYRVKKVVSGMAHITGGGLVNNVNRAFGDDLDARIDRSAWTVPPVFEYIREAGHIDSHEMDRVFNMGIGYVLIVRPSFADSIERQLARLGERPHVIGEIVPGAGRVYVE